MAGILKIRTVIAMVAGMLCAACGTDDELDRLNTSNWSPEAGLPLINTQVSAADFLKNAGEQSLVSTGQNDRLILSYHGSFRSAAGGSWIQSPNISLTTSAAQDVLQFLFSGDHTISEMLLQSGTMEVEMGLAEHESGTLEITIPALTQNGIPFQQTLPISNGSVSGTLDLSGYTVSFPDPGHEVEVSHQVTLDDDTDVTGENPLTLQLQQLLFEHLVGEFEPFDFGVLSDTLFLNIFRNWTDGAVYVVTPQIQAQVYNSYGFPIQGQVSTIEVLESGSTVFEVSGTYTDISHDFGFPQQPGDPVTIGDLTIEQGEADLESMVGIYPNRIRFGMAFQMVPEPGETYFMADTSHIRGNYEMKLPFEGRIEDAIIRDTFLLAENLRRTLRSLQTLRFRLAITNTFPFSMQTQVYFADHTGTVLDSLQSDDPTIIASGIPTGNHAHLPQEQVTWLEMPPEKIGRIQDATQVFLKVMVTTFNEGQENINIYASDHFNLRLGMVVQPD